LRKRIREGREQVEGEVRWCAVTSAREESTLSACLGKTTTRGSVPVQLGTGWAKVGRRC
jgi:hypothetical protein